MKKLLVVLLLLGALLGLLSCNSSKPSQTTPSTTTPSTTPSITTPPQTTTTPAPTTAPERKINVGKMGYVISYNGQTTADNRLKSLLSASLSAKGISLSSIPEGFAANAYEILLTNDVLTKSKLSKQSGYNSGAEVQIPYMLILLSALLMIYNDKSSSTRLVFIDEPFAKMDPINVKIMLGFMKEQRLQMIF